MIERQRKLTLFTGHPRVYRVLMEELHIFPEAFAQDGEAVRSNDGFQMMPEMPGGSPLQQKTREVTLLALEALGTRLLQAHAQGRITDMDLLTTGVREAEEIIAYTRTIWNLLADKPDR